jgi:Arc/MetJ-type ribon-helix-helix transcriptional regulator
VTDPIPTKFEDDEGTLIDFLVIKSGLSRSAVIRRCVRLMGHERAKRGPEWNWLEETGKPLDLPIDELEKIVAEAEDAKRLLKHAKRHAGRPPGRSSRDDGKTPPAAQRSSSSEVV